MKTIAALILLVSFSSVAGQTTCNSFGDQTTCTTYDNGRIYTQTCTRFGNQVSCNSY